MSLDRLQNHLNYRFKTIGLLTQALTHRSHSSLHNERLEFLGDSVLNFVIAHILYARLSNLNEGDLSRIRSSLVKQATLASISTRIELPTYLRLGEGELKSGGFRRPSILADALEAIFGAIYLDSGFESAHQVVGHLYNPLLESVDFDTLGKDAKTLLQENLQAQRYQLPNYTVVSTKGAAHDQQFEVECAIAELDVTTHAVGASRRAAEQLAAEEALKLIGDKLPRKGQRKRVRKVEQLTLPVSVEQDIS